MKTGRIIAVVLAAIVVCGISWLLRRHCSNIPTTAPTLKPATRRSTLRHISHKSGGDAAKVPNETDQLTREEINAYLTLKNRSATSLLVAYSLLRDPNFLKEAAARYPKEPRVQLYVLKANLFPGNRSHWLDAFKQSAPDNPLPNYQAALDHFKAGRRELAVAELTQGSEKSALDTYWSDLAHAVAEAYKQSGFSPADANLMGNTVVAIPPFSDDLQQLSSLIAELAFQYLQTGNLVEAESLSMLGLRIGNQLTKGNAGKLLSNELAGNEIEQSFLRHLDQSTIMNLDGTTQTAGELFAKLRVRKRHLNDLMYSVPLDEIILSQALSDDDVLEVSERIRTKGETAAMEWLRDKLGPNLRSQPQAQPSASERK